MQLGSVSCYLLSGIIGYLLGSCPNGLLISKWKGIDIRRRGSGNIGATNVLRVLGKQWGYLVFILDALKGFLAVRIAFQFVAATPAIAHPELPAIFAAFTCILGHTFPVWLGFKGGKGVATSAGALLGLMPLAVVSVFLVWTLTFQVTRYVSIASIVAAASLPFFVALYLRCGVLHGENLLPFSIVIALLVIWRHRGNIERLMHGKEQRFRPKR